MSVVSRSDSACARSVSSGIPVITPPVQSFNGRGRHASAPPCAASSSNCRRSASSRSSGALSGRLRTAIDKPPFQLTYLSGDFGFVCHNARTDTHTRSRTICRLMPTPLSSPRKILAAVIAVVALAGCQSGPNARPVPSVAQIGSELKCLNGDHGFSDNQAGWGFCYPGTWQYRIRAQGSHSPAPHELDLTFDIIDVPCSSPSAGASARPVCSPGAGLFAFMIVSTYERGNLSNLATWAQARLPKVPDRTVIRGG